jgi:hypothetical protein
MLRMGRSATRPTAKDSCNPKSTAVQPSNTGADSRVPQHSHEPVKRQVTTDIIASAWIALNLYALCLVFSHPARASAEDLVLVFVPMLTAVAVLERWRWARLAMFGIAAMVIGDMGYSVARIAYLTEASLFPLANYYTILKTVLRGFTGSAWFGLAAMVIGLATMAWMLRGSVKREFEHRKRSRTRRGQLGIAGFLVTWYVLSLTRSAHYKGISVALAMRDEAEQKASLTRIAMRTGAMRKPAVRK